jgi:hypothetical protein
MLLSLIYCHMGNMRKPKPSVVEVRFVPLPAHERDNRRRRLRVLLLTGAARLAQVRRDSDQMPSGSDTPGHSTAQGALG